MSSAPETAVTLASGKGHKDENFPVASWLVRPDCRAPIMAFYRFARAADDIADHESVSAEEKLRLLEAMRVGLSGEGAPEATALSEVARAQGLPLTHAEDLLGAFVQDCVKTRYADWNDLIAYCRLSAMPVGRFVLDVHGEDPAIWPMNDALCAALQVINHLQDCGKDYRTLDRVYIPEPMLAAAELSVEVLAQPRAPEALRAIITTLTRQTQSLLQISAPFARAIRDARLSTEVAVIQRLAEDLCHMLLTRDPLSDDVHHSKPRAAWLALGAIARNCALRAFA